MVESGDFVLPGTEVGFSEEVIPGTGTYEENGKIFASVAGIVDMDSDERKISVEPKTSVPPELKDGTTILGVVMDTKPQVAVVEIVKIKGNERGLAGRITGTVHISKIRDSYVSEISTELGFGDIILAKVINAGRTPLQLTIIDNELGVIKSYCTKCGAPLELKDKKAFCNECNRSARKKLSTEYGKGQV